MLPSARICCLDLDTFFVSVERLLDPSLEGKPIIVGGRKGSRGVVTCASYEVRKLGVRSGMPMAEASRRAPNAIYLPTRHDTYGPYAAQVREILLADLPRDVPVAVLEGRREGVRLLGRERSLLRGHHRVVHAEELELSVKRLRAPGLRVLDTLPPEGAGPLLTAWLDMKRWGVG